MREGAIFLFAFSVDEHGVALVESAALGILAGQANGIASSNTDPWQCFREAVIDGGLPWPISARCSRSLTIFGCT